MVHVYGIGGDLTQIGTIPDDINVIRETIVGIGAVMVIIDPLMAHLAASINSHRDQDIRRALRPLTELARQDGFALVAVRHLVKSAATTPMYRGGGSIGVAASARCVLVAGTDPGDDSVKVLAPVKSSLSALPVSLAFTIDEATVGQVPTSSVRWMGTSTLTASDVTVVPVAGSRPSASGAASDHLRAVLADGPVSASDVVKGATMNGMSMRTLERAKAALGVISERAGFGGEGAWYWRLPVGAFPNPAMKAMTAVPPDGGLRLVAVNGGEDDGGDHDDRHDRRG